jgi:glucose/mannose transport system permease protein
MASATQATTYGGVEVERRRHGWLTSERLLPPLILGPTIIGIFIFVYGFIGATVWVSLSNWGTAKINWSIRHPFGITYEKLFQQSRFQTDLRNTIFFTVMFLLAAVGGGLILAILLDRKVFGNSIFRNIFLFPYALSFITTGVSWRWIFNPQTGINLLFEQSGLNWLLGKIGLGAFAPAWLTDPRVVGKINGPLGSIWPWSEHHITTQLGLPMAMIPVTIAAAWQLSGFAMAMYLAGMGTIPNEVREAAELDGATGWQVYRDIIIPMLRPITVSVLIILGHVSLKIFDLIYSMSGHGPGFATDVPGIFVFDKTFGGLQYNLGAAASIIMLLLVSLVIVPYLYRQLKEL